MYLKFSPHPLPLPSGERGRVRGHKMLEEYYQNLTCKNLISFQNEV